MYSSVYGISSRIILAHGALCLLAAVLRKVIEVVLVFWPTARLFVCLEVFQIDDRYSNVINDSDNSLGVAISKVDARNRG